MSLHGRPCKNMNGRQKHSKTEFLNSVYEEMNYCNLLRLTICLFANLQEDNIQIIQYTYKNVMKK